MAVLFAMAFRLCQNSLSFYLKSTCWAYHHVGDYRGGRRGGKHSDVTRTCGFSNALGSLSLFVITEAAIELFHSKKFVNAPYSEPSLLPCRVSFLSGGVHPACRLKPEASRGPRFHSFFPPPPLPPLFSFPLPLLPGPYTSSFPLSPLLPSPPASFAKYSFIPSSLVLIHITF